MFNCYFCACTDHLTFILVVQPTREKRKNRNAITLEKQTNGAIEPSKARSMKTLSFRIRTLVSAQLTKPFRRPNHQNDAKTKTFNPKT
jgi:hypothetical protein